MKLRLGKLSYLNNAPMYYGLPRNNHSLLTESCTIVEGPPSYLNHCIRQKEIDLTVASSIEYARNFEGYLILPDLSISSDGPVQSVLLLSKAPMEELHGQPLLLTSDSETSVGLVKILLSQRGIEPVYIRGKVPGQGGPEAGGNGGNGSCCPPPEFTAFLVIGDRALHLWQSEKERGPYSYLYDLGEEWKKMTGLPFVFALWMVRKEAFCQAPELVFQVQQALLDSRDYSLTHLEEFIASVKTQPKLPAAVCRSYIQNLRYELSSRYQQGLLRYYKYLHEMGEIPQPVQGLELLPCQKFQHLI
ncbi:MAG: menaquinone biosynthesis protein [bacterium]